jgi:hypothetical protein
MSVVPLTFINATGGEATTRRIPHRRRVRMRVYFMEAAIMTASIARTAVLAALAIAACGCRPPHDIRPPHKEPLVGDRAGPVRAAGGTADRPRTNTAPARP